MYNSSMYRCCAILMSQQLHSHMVQPGCFQPVPGAIIKIVGFEDELYFISIVLGQSSGNLLFHSV